MKLQDDINSEYDLETVDSVLEQTETSRETVPSWFADRRGEAWVAYEKLAWPSRKNEDWRFGSPKKSILESEEIAGGGASLDLEPAGDNVLRFVFENNELVAAPGNIPEGLHALSLGDAIAQKESLLKEKMPALQGKLGSEKLAAFHRGRFSDGVVLHVDANAKVDQLVEVVHVISGDKTVLPYILIVAEEGSSLRVLERFVSTNVSDAATVIAVSDVVVEKAASLRYLVTQDLNVESKLVRLTDSKVGEEAVSKVASVHIGADWVREETYSTVTGKESKSEILSITVPETGQEYDQRTFQNHAVGHALSDLLYKNTLFGKAKTVFSGLIFVGDGAHHTDAYQTCRNLLMSDDAEATSMPGLEINADQVKCSHGSTSSQVNEEEIFYLCARGIDPKTARNLVARGFSVEVAERMGDEALEELMVEMVSSKFARVV